MKTYKVCSQGRKPSHLPFVRQQDAHLNFSLINSRLETMEPDSSMKRIFLTLLAAACAAASTAQTPAKPAAPAAKAAKPAAAASTPAPWIKLPPGVPSVKGIVKVAFALRYEDIKLGTGKDAEPGKLYKVHYTGWLSATGVKFDSSYDHRPPVTGKDGKPELDADGKPKLGDPMPLQFIQGGGPMGRGPFPGFDQGFYGMKVGGKRRLFVPWQIAYGTHEIPGRPPDHPGIPAKSDMIFDVELVDVADAPAPPMRPNMPPGARPMPGGPAAPHPGAIVPPNGATPAPGTAPGSAPGTAPGTPASPAKPGQPPAPGTPATPASPTAPAPGTPPSTPPPPSK